VPGPVFVGGTGRCGTHAVAALAASAGRYVAIPAELRLHASEAGLPAFTAGRISRRELVRGLRTHWWRHSPEWDPTEVRGIHRIVSRSRYTRAVARLATSPPGADRLDLSRRFLAALLDALAPHPHGWVEKSPANCAHAGFLADLFPDMRLVHVIRDGRDVACSLMRVPWAPDDFPAALAMWEWNLLAAHHGVREARPECVHEVRFEDLVANDRDRASRSLLAFLGIEHDPRPSTFFVRELTPDRARIGRWRTDLAPSYHRRANRLYRAALGRLAAAGATLPAAGTEFPAAPRAASPLDPWAAATA
jgi:hypothetical protein